MKKLLLMLVICVSSFMIYTNNVKALSGADYSTITNLSQNCYFNSTCSNYSTRDGFAFIDISSSSNYYEYELNFNVSVRPYSSAFFFPFTFVNEQDTTSYSCTHYRDSQIYVPYSSTTYFGDGTTSNTSYLANNNPSTVYVCDGYSSSQTDKIGLNVTYNFSYDNSSTLTKIPCTILGNNNSFYAYCPLDSTLDYSKITITNLTFMFNNDSTDYDKIKLSYPYERMVFELNYDKNINSNLDTIKSKLDYINSNTNSINNNTTEIKNDIKSDNVSGAEGSADDLKNNSAFQDNTGLSGVISMPLTFVNSLTNTCQPINLNIPYMDVDVTIPCMQSIITDKMPLLANLIKIIVNGFIVYRILLDIFQIVRNAKNPEDDRIEVLDL